MTRLIPLVAAPLTLLAACGQDGSGAADAPPTPVRVLSEAEKTALLAALPAPYDQADLENGRRVFARCRSCHTITEGGPDLTGRTCTASSAAKPAGR